MGWPPIAVIDSGVPSTLPSLLRGSKTTGWSSVAGTVSGAAAGASAAAVTDSVSVAVTLSTPSLTV